MFEGVKILGKSAKDNCKKLKEGVAVLFLDKGGVLDKFDEIVDGIKNGIEKKFGISDEEIQKSISLIVIVMLLFMVQVGGLMLKNYDGNVQKNSSSSIEESVVKNDNISLLKNEQTEGEQFGVDEIFKAFELSVFSVWFFVILHGILSDLREDREFIKNEKNGNS